MLSKETLLEISTLDGGKLPANEAIFTTMTKSTLLLL